MRTREEAGALRRKIEEHAKTITKIRMASKHLENYPLWFRESSEARAWAAGEQPRIRYTESFVNEVENCIEIHQYEDAKAAAFLRSLLETKWFPTMADTIHAADLMNANGIVMVQRYVQREDLHEAVSCEKIGQSDKLYDWLVLRSDLPRTWELQYQLLKMAGVRSAKSRRNVSKAAGFRSMSEMNDFLFRMYIPRPYEINALCRVSAEGISMEDVCDAILKSDPIRKEIPLSDRFVLGEEESGRIKQFVLYERETISA